MESLVSAIYQTSGAAQFDLSAIEFSNVISEIAERYLPPEAGPAALRELLAKLHAEELVLARACASGHSYAWEIFLTRYRECLYQSAASITKDETMGRELADSLYADLYTSDSRSGRHISKLASYTGVGSLAGWLRTVLARAYIDRYRSEQRLVPLDEEDENDPRLAMPATEAALPVDPRLEKAIEEALGSLAPADGYVLACYFLDGQTLADIARTLKVHEATVSRRLQKVTAGLRKSIRGALLRLGMSRAQAEEALQTDVRDVQVNISARLREIMQESRTGSSTQQRDSGSVPNPKQRGE